MNHNPYCDEPRHCPPTWVVTRTYTAKCPEGMTGDPVTATRQARSTVSEEDATQKARACAREAAEAQLQCHWEASSSAIGSCGRQEVATGVSFISLADAHQNALNAASAAAEYWCYTHPYGENEESNLPRNPLDEVAVILVCHPGYIALLPAAIASIDRQTVPFTRKVLVFDAACDAEVPTLQVPEDWSVVVGNWMNPNVARNEGLKLMLRTNWLVFWDADNRMPDTYFQQALETLTRADERIGVCYPDVQDCYLDGTFGYCHKMPQWSLAAGQFKSLADTGSFWRTAAVREVGGWRFDQKGHDDFALSLRIFRAGWRGQHLGIPINRMLHDSNRSRNHDPVQALWTAYSFAFVTLWSGNKETAERILVWLATANIPPNSALYWVDNSGGALRRFLDSVVDTLLKSRFDRITIIDAGEPYSIDPEEPYKHLDRHTHVAHLYNRVLPGLREEVIVFLEDDTLPPKHGIRTLLENIRPGSKVAMSAAVYRSRHNPERICASRNKKMWTDVPKWDELPEQPFYVGMTGGGFALVMNHALQTCLPMRCEQTPDGRLMGWDGNLGLSLSALGYELVCDPRVKCQHLCKEVIDYEQTAIAALGLPQGCDH